MESILLRRVGKPDSRSIDGYIADGGYSALRKVLTTGMTPEQVTEEVKESGLRGRGGAGFPTGHEVEVPPERHREARSTSCFNADESRAGHVQQPDPDGEGPAPGARGHDHRRPTRSSAATAYIYIRCEFYDGARILDAGDRRGPRRRASSARTSSAPALRLDIYVHRGAGAYICGEETGLIESLEGKRGWPRIKPPFPAVEGVFRRPTIVNNVETLACVTHIVERGADWFAKHRPQREEHRARSSTASPATSTSPASTRRRWACR